MNDMISQASRDINSSKIMNLIKGKCMQNEDRRDQIEAFDQ